MGNARHAVNGWLGSLGRQFQLDESGRCFLQQDAQTGIVVYAPDEGDDVFVYGDLMRAPPDGSPEFYKQVLALNAMPSLTAGATISLEPRSGQLLAVLSQPVQALDMESFLNILANMPQAVQALRTRLAGMAQHQPAGTARPGYLIGTRA